MQNGICWFLHIIKLFEIFNIGFNIPDKPIFIPLNINSKQLSFSRLLRLQKVAYIPTDCLINFTNFHCRMSLILKSHHIDLIRDLCCSFRRFELQDFMHNVEEIFYWLNTMHAFSNNDEGLFLDPQLERDQLIH